MVDPSVIRSNKLAGTHFRFGSPSSSEGFPPGTLFRAPLLLANTGEAAAVAHISVEYTSAEVSQNPSSTDRDSQGNPIGLNDMNQAKRITLEDRTLSPGSVEVIDLDAELAGRGVSGPAEEAGVDISYDATPGQVIGQLTSFNQTGDYSFEVPIKDPEAMTEMMEGIYPWTIEQGWRSVLHLKNTTADTVGALVMFELPGQRFYNPDRVVLKPYQSIAIDIQKLKDSKQPDVLKRAFPVDALHGQVQWRQEIPYSVIARLERTNIDAGIASSFSCGASCCVYYQQSPYLSPSSYLGQVGGSVQLTAWMRGNDCNNAVFLYPLSPQPTIWTSSNNSVATVNSSGQVTFVAPGSATISTGVRVTQYLQNFEGRCQSSYYTQTIQATVTVAPTATITVKFSGPKTAGDGLIFGRSSCSENLGGGLVCPNAAIPVWPWNLEVSAVVSDDASKWTVTQTIDSQRAKGLYRDSTGTHAFDTGVISTMCPPCDPLNGYVQQTAGQKVIFYIDGPGPHMSISPGETVDSGTWVKNFTSHFCSTMVPGPCYTMQWSVKTVISPGAFLNVPASFPANGWMSTSF